MSLEKIEARELDALQERADQAGALGRFFKAVRDHFWADDGGDLTGGDFQDLALKHGLIVEVPYDPEKHGTRDLDEFGVEPGDQWFETVATIKAVLP